MGEDKDLHEFLRERMQERNLSLERLADLSGVPIAHLEMLISGRTEDLPAAPYVRGYINSLGRVLHFDADVWWVQIKRARVLPVSGGHDILPSNRFARNMPSRGKIAGILAGVVLLVFIVVRFSSIVGRPKLSMIYPVEEVMVVHDATVTLRGTVENGDKLTVNNEVVPVREGELWEKEIALKPGPNVISVSAGKLLGLSATREFRIILESPNTTSTITSTTAVAATTSSVTASSGKKLPEPTPIQMPATNTGFPAQER
jgi:hypothetical protein